MAGTDAKQNFDVPLDVATEARAIAEAEADLAAGRIVPHAEVAKWLESWGTADELPCPMPKQR
jgi:predicted transcriptional regulator